MENRLAAAEAEGSPARAGIDRMTPCSTGGSTWFPRTRGDRPIVPLVDGKCGTVPPHARG